MTVAGKNLSVDLKLPKRQVKFQTWLYVIKKTKLQLQIKNMSRDLKMAKMTMANWKIITWLENGENGTCKFKLRDLKFPKWQLQFRPESRDPKMLNMRVKS